MTMQPSIDSATACTAPNTCYVPTWLLCVRHCFPQNSPSVRANHDNSATHDSYSLYCTFDERVE